MFKGTGGATLSQDPESKEYALQRQFPLALLDADSLAAELEKFVDSLERWKGVWPIFVPLRRRPPPWSRKRCRFPPLATAAL